MHVVVVGAGLAGIAAAWELQLSGHSVTVLDRGAEPATETSHANAGLVAPGHAMPWASPKIPGTLLKSLFVDDQAFRIKPRLDWQMIRWGLRFLRQCSAARHRENTASEYRFCRYGQERLREVTEQAGLDYHAQRGGLLYLFRDDTALREGIEAMRVVEDLGHELRVLDCDGIVALDPAYGQSRGRFAGAVHCPSDESGDARLFTLGLAEACRCRGVEFEFDCTVKRIVIEGNRIHRLETSGGERAGDVYVLASGVEAPRLARPIGLDLPIYPVKGYSLTFPIGPEHVCPVIGGLDEHNLIAFSRLGDRLRVTATAEITGYDTSYKHADFRRVTEAFSELLPEAADYTQPSYWSCLRPMSPTGSPIVGACRYENLFLNVGHGNMGWTMSCGTGRLVADIIDGREPELPTAVSTDY